MFIFNFGNYNLSDNISHWAEFGSYFGGVLNPIFAIINICVFVYLTVVVQEFSNKNHEELLEMNRKIALMSMKKEELNHFKSKMDNVISNWEVDMQNTIKANQVLYTYNTLEYRMSYLFPKMYESKENKMFRKSLVETINEMQIKKKAAIGASVFNIYGMLISKLSKMVVE